MRHLRTRARERAGAFHNRFGTAGVVIAVVALIAALSGTALAAGGALSGKQKKEVEKIAKKYAGKPGATGAAGANGTNGTNGKDGTNGTNGAPGAAGKSVVTEAAGGECPEGGTKFKVEGAATSRFVCNGEEGEEGEPGVLHPGETLPHNAIETGVWSFTGLESGEKVIVPISFTIPLALPLEETVHFETEANFETHCHGNVLEPQGFLGTPGADSGHLCVYAFAGTEGLSNVQFEGITQFPHGGLESVGEVGAFLHFKSTGANGSGAGSWAVAG